MTTINKTVNTTETEKEYIPDFIRVGEFFIQDRKNLFKKFDCRLSNQVRAACDMYKYYTDPSELNDKMVFIDHLFYQRVAEYLVKNKYPRQPNPFDTHKVHISHIKGVKKTVPPDYVYSDNDAKIIVKLFTSNDINIAIKKCRLTGKAHERYKEEFMELVKSNKEKQVNGNNDLFNQTDKTSNNKDDNVYSSLFVGVDLSDYNKVDERCKLLRNTTHLYTCNNALFEKIVSEKENYAKQGLAENERQKAVSFVKIAPPEIIKKILKLKGD